MYILHIYITGVYTHIYIYACLYNFIDKKGPEIKF